VYLTSIAFSLGALMFYYLFYQSRLIPRWLSVWGLAGAVLYVAAPLLDMLGHGFGILQAPLAVAEIVLAVWLIARGLNSPAPQGGRWINQIHYIFNGRAPGTSGTGHQDLRAAHPRMW